jgi:hypothetical protein
LVCVLALFGAGYLLGSNRSHVTELVGVAQVGDHVASIFVGDTAYGFRDSVPWFDAEGAMHDGGWPDCLGDGPGTRPNIHFGEQDVTYPDGSWGPQVVYVDCRS